MQKLVIVTVASLMMGSAFAMPSEHGSEPSYSFQGKATRVQVVSRQRNIPAPSSWTPPERKRSAYVHMVRRQQPKRVGGTSFSNPSFSNPTYSNPAVSSKPAYSNPSYSNPSYSNPSASNPSYSNPSYSNPSTGNPSYGNPSYGNPTL
jgi:hypothetical protein